MIGRDRQTNELQLCVESNRSEFVILTGRRRIGKTYLINEFFANKFAFSYTGGHNLSKKKQLELFSLSLKEYSDSVFAPTLKTWFEAFETLKQYLNSCTSYSKKVLFFDEMPWIDTPKSDFVTALEYFWNSWAALQKDILLVAAGSATSWMADKLIKNKGGLHNRITHRLYLEPFTLKEVEQFLENQDCHWDRFQIAQAYMIFGGVPYYWSLLDLSASLAQNVNRLLFERNAPLRQEFDELYNALFCNAEQYISVIKCLYSKNNGLTRTEIAKATSIQGSTLTKILNNLVLCDFITDNIFYKHTKKDKVYRLSDFYTQFYLRFIEHDLSRDYAKWSHLINTPAIISWQGIAFEQLCILHVEQIKNRLGISGISTEVSTWRGNGMQIDLIIERADRVINLCEIKFSVEPYTISKEYAEHLRLRIATFRQAENIRKTLLTTFISTYGVMRGKNSSVVDSEILLDDLFA